MIRFVGASTAEQLVNLCNNWFQYNVTHLTDTNSIVFAHSNNVYPDAVITGISLPNLGNSWSFVFKDKIDSVSDLSPYYWNHQTVYNLVSVHELLHQLGPSQLNEHILHCGTYSDICALHSPVNFFTDDTLRLINHYMWFVCGRHVTMVKDYIGNLPDPPCSPQKPIVINKASGISSNDNKYKLTMTLGKDVYKEFEPVMARFELINLDDKPLNAFGLFNEEQLTANFKISDDQGNTYTTNKYPFNIDMIDMGSNIIQPGDTLVTGMPINNWGERKEIKILDSYGFEQQGYFPAERNYTAYYITPFGNNNSLISNEIHFSVIPLQSEDRDLIELNKIGFKTMKFDSVMSIAISKYPDNILIEYFMGEALPSIYNKIVGPGGSKHFGEVPELVNTYENFFQKFPSTYFMYRYNFMLPYYIKLLSGAKNYNSLIMRMKNDNNNSQLNSYLTNSRTMDRIRKIVEMATKF